MGMPPRPLYAERRPLPRMLLDILQPQTIIDRLRDRAYRARIRPERPEPSPRVKSDPKPILKFVWKFGELHGYVRAKSRVDARSKVKHELGIPIKRRLPIGMMLECVG